MFFNTWAFVSFYVAVRSLHVVLTPRRQNRWLLAASYLFYGLWDWRFCGLLLISTLVDYQVGLRLHATHQKPQQRRLLYVSLATNLGILGSFKYFNFFADSATELLSRFGFAADVPTLNIILPIGISFYTFQSLSYTIDIYRRQIEPIQDKFAFGLYVAYFSAVGCRAH